MRPAAFVPFLCLVLACFGAQAQVPSRDFFAFVLLAEGSDGLPLPIVRSVAEGATACPVLRTTAGGGSTTMTPRRRPPGGHFDAVMVCEARYPVARRPASSWATAASTCRSSRSARRDAWC